MLLRNLKVSPYSPLFTCQYKTSKPMYVLPSLLPYSSSFTRSQYLDAIWIVVNFEEAEARFAEAT